LLQRILFKFNNADVIKLKKLLKRILFKVKLQPTQELFSHQVGPPMAGVDVKLINWEEGNYRYSGNLGHTMPASAFPLSYICRQIFNKLVRVVHILASIVEK
jgi:hypothetical protein